MPPPRPIAIALGANQGDRFAAFDRAVGLLDSLGVGLLRLSAYYWTRPLPGSAGPRYLNAAGAFRTDLSPLALLDRCREVERTMGRRRGERGAPRVIDLDLIFYGSVRMSHPRLRLPHPAWRERDFVLAPLLDLGIPPPSRIALPGFRRLLAELPAEKRCIESRVGRP